MFANLSKRLNRLWWAWTAHAFIWRKRWRWRRKWWCSAVAMCFMFTHYSRRAYTVATHATNLQRVQDHLIAVTLTLNKYLPMCIATVLLLLLLLLWCHQFAVAPCARQSMTSTATCVHANPCWVYALKHCSMAFINACPSDWMCIALCTCAHTFKHDK